MSRCRPLRSTFSPDGTSIGCESGCDESGCNESVCDESVCDESGCETLSCDEFVDSDDTVDSHSLSFAFFINELREEELGTFEGFLFFFIRFEQFVGSESKGSFLMSSDFFINIVSFCCFALYLWLLHISGGWEEGCMSRLRTTLTGQ